MILVNVSPFETKNVHGAPFCIVTNIYPQQEIIFGMKIWAQTFSRASFRILVCSDFSSELDFFWEQLVFAFSPAFFSERLHPSELYEPCDPKILTCSFLLLSLSEPWWF